MKIPTIRKILREDLGGKDLPVWVEGLLSPLNQFIDTVTVALRGRLSLGQNVSGTVVSLSFTHNVAVSKINPQFTGKVIGVIPLYFSGQSMNAFGWTRNDDSSINVTIGFVAGGTTKATCTLFLIPEIV